MRSAEPLSGAHLGYGMVWLAKSPRITVLICNIMIGVSRKGCVTARRDCAFESATAGLRS